MIVMQWYDTSLFVSIRHVLIWHYAQNSVSYQYSGRVFPLLYSLAALAAQRLPQRIQNEIERFGCHVYQPYAFSSSSWTWVLPHLVPSCRAQNVWSFLEICMATSSVKIHNVNMTVKKLICHHDHVVWSIGCVLLMFLLLIWTLNKSTKKWGEMRKLSQFVIFDFGHEIGFERY